MNTTITRKKRYAAALAAAAAAPALLFAGAGTAQAYTSVTPTGTGWYGVEVKISSWGGNGFNSGGRCTYSAEPILGTTDPGNLIPLPVYGVPFEMTPGTSQTLWFPGTPTGTDWNVAVTCTEGVDNNWNTVATW